MALLISQTLRHGLREGLRVAFAPILSDIPVVLLFVFVFSEVTNIGPALAWMPVAGGIFVGYLGYESFRSPGATVGEAQTAPRSLTKAVLVNFLNPHVYLFWGTVGAPTLLKGLKRTDGAAVAFAGGFYLCLVGSKVLMAILVSRSRNVLTGRGYQIVMRSLGVLLAVVAVWMLAGGVMNLMAGPQPR